LVLLAYLLAFAAALIVDLALSAWPVVPRLALADVVATVVVFGFSVRFRNSSFYDPYWSVVPLPLALYFAFLAPESAGLTLRSLLVFVLTGAWGARLTWNWLRRWEGLHHEDWRYSDLQAKTGRWYWLVSFLGIHMFPTALVFLGCLPLLGALSLSAEAFGFIDLFAVSFTAGAIWLEAEADRQLVEFLGSEPEPGTFLETGFWAWCRHPNYLGEILFWWGLFFVGWSARPDETWLFAAPLAMTALFVLISVPMIDRRMIARRPEYARRMRSHFGLLPFGKRG
jgi:steroid 5-alpha reductase family enzyme